MLHPGLAIVLLSQHIETRHSVDLVATGRFGYLLKDRVLAVDEFLDALDRVAAGDRRSIPRWSADCSVASGPTTGSRR